MRWDATAWPAGRMMNHSGRRAKCHAGASRLERRVRQHSRYGPHLSVLTTGRNLPCCSSTAPLPSAVKYASLPVGETTMYWRKKPDEKRLLVSDPMCSNKLPSGSGERCNGRATLPTLLAWVRRCPSIPIASLSCSDAADSGAGSLPGRMIVTRIFSPDGPVNSNGDCVEVTLYPSGQSS